MIIPMFSCGCLNSELWGARAESTGHAFCTRLGAVGHRRWPRPSRARDLARGAWNKSIHCAGLAIAAGPPINRGLARIALGRACLSERGGVCCVATELPSGRPRVRRRRCREADRQHRTRHAVAAGPAASRAQTERESRTATWSPGAERFFGGATTSAEATANSIGTTYSRSPQLGHRAAAARRRRWTAPELLSAEDKTHRRFDHTVTSWNKHPDLRRLCA